jgi:hypothetical protein
MGIRDVLLLELPQANAIAVTTPSNSVSAASRNGLPFISDPFPVNCSHAKKRIADFPQPGS